MGADFSGWATKAGIKCTDGRTIMPDAFKHMDGLTVPLVWQHMHNTPDNVLGHAVLEARPEGLYAYGFFNETPQGVNAKALVEHKDIKFLSIYANQLIEKAKQVFHGMVREVSLTLAGANSGALIDYVNIAHADGSVDVAEDEAVIHTGLELEFEDLEHAAADATVQDVIDSMDDDQKAVLSYMVSRALESKTAAAHTGTNPDDKKPEDGKDGATDDTKTEGDLTHKEGTTDVTKNVFDQSTTGDGKTAVQHTLSHSDVRGIVASAVKSGSLKQAMEAYALAHGIENIDVMFPDAKNFSNTPEFNSRQMEWVAGVLNGTRHTPFSRVKSLVADITLDDARARGYVKGSMKKEEFFSLSKRTTSPTTIYKKQKLDRDDIIDITDLDVVAFMKAEMKLMLNEELARAILISDGRAVDDEDKIKDPEGATDGIGIRSVLHDDPLYVTHININIDDASSDYNEIVEAVMRNRRFYRGSGSPTLYTTSLMLSNMLLSKDGFERYRYANKAELANKLMVSDIVEVEVMESEPDLIGIIVNLSDYSIGADKGGEVNFFDDFDIDFNQYKYLYETRLSGALTKIKSALVLHRETSTDVLVTPTKPSFDPVTGLLTINDTTNVVYKHGATTVNNAGSPYTVVVGTPWTIDATPASGYFFEAGDSQSWTFVTEA